MGRLRSVSTSAGFPLAFTAPVQHREDGATDSLGNRVRRWGATEHVKVAGWAIDGSDVNGPDDSSVRHIDWVGQLFALPGELRAGDKVTLGDATFLIADGGKDYTHGPWWSPGLYVYKLQIYEVV